MSGMTRILLVSTRVADKVYLVDTNVLSEARKGRDANTGVQDFFRIAQRAKHPLYLSAITIGEIRKGITMARNRGDVTQAKKLEGWLGRVLSNYASKILDFTVTEAEVWGQLLAFDSQNVIDKQIAATALCYDLTVVTGNTRHFEKCSVKLFNPFND